MARVIVYTRHSDKGVSVCTPTEWAIAMMGCGGLWADKPRGFGEVQIARQIARGVHADAARRYVKAVQFGGLTTAEAYAVIRDRDCAHLGYHIDLMDYADLPDRWFRNAWKRSRNGGPVGVDLKLARPIQWRHLREAVARENKRRAEDFDGDFGPLEPDWSQIRTAIKRARDDEELRRVWPVSLTSVPVPRD